LKCWQQLEPPHRAQHVFGALYATVGQTEELCIYTHNFLYSRSCNGCNN
jgi:hypothetical protein